MERFLRKTAANRKARTGLSKTVPKCVPKPHGQLVEWVLRKTDLQVVDREKRGVFTASSPRTLARERASSVGGGALVGRKGRTADRRADSTGSAGDSHSPCD